MKKEIKVVLYYLFISFFWIFLTDKLLASIIDDKQILVTYETYKGWIFIVVTAFIFYSIIHNAFDKLRNKEEQLKEKYRQIRQDNQKIKELNKEIKQKNKSLRKQKDNLQKNYREDELRIEKMQNMNQKLEESYEKLNQLTNNLYRVIDLTTNITEKGMKNENSFLSSLLNTAINIIPEADYGSVYKFKEGHVNFVDTVGHDIKTLKELDIPEEIFSMTRENINVVDHIQNFTFEALEGEQMKQFKNATKPIKQSLTFGLYEGEERIVGISIDIDEERDYTYNGRAVDAMKAFKSIANAFYIIEKYKKMHEEFQKEIIISMLSMLEIHDVYTKGHSQNVAQLASKTAEKMGLTNNQINHAYWAGMVHDIGKLLIPKRVLNKDGSLTDFEYEKIKKHPEWGYRTLKKSDKLKEIAKYVLYHHERWDGRGYPEGIEADNIPLISRILTVVDAWDAMRSDRSYRPALKQETAIEELKLNKGTQFDGSVVDVFLEIIKT